jgi:Polyketide cyclase / dehydrase and lipid transport
MRPPFRSKQEVIINAPVEAVWEFNMDITRIPSFHPRVVKVELLSGKSLREPGVSYRCVLSGGKHTCVEKDIEIVPMQKLVTVLPGTRSEYAKSCLTTWSKRQFIASGSLPRR